MKKFRNGKKFHNCQKKFAMGKNPQRSESLGSENVRLSAKLEKQKRRRNCCLHFLQSWSIQVLHSFHPLFHIAFANRTVFLELHCFPCTFRFIEPCSPFSSFSFLFITCVSCVLIIQRCTIKHCRDVITSWDNIPA